MKIWEIAEKLGYENPHYFSYSFKKYTGRTPQKYREDCEIAVHDNAK
jgi:two-component system response regulator YesN